MPIQVLDQNTINQIAAGEVVERPASVVKELMENAIDAGATAVTAEIRDGGIGFIRITDNGCGIPGKELPLAFLRHSTSKIRTAADLLTVASLGFRGEALSSIAAVSQVEVITRTAESLSGFRYQIEGGAEKSLEEVGAPEGTTFISRNLFFNTPARRKFLKTPATEGGHVADLVEKIALSHPEISIRLIVNNQIRLHTSGNHNLKDIIYTVYGREIAANLIPVRAENELFSISGFIGKPVIARGNRNFENYFINGRYIRSSLVARAIEDGYRSYMMQHKYPFTLLHFQVEPEFIDVNVHPSKMEIRFKDGELVYRTICSTIGEALKERELIPSVEVPRTEASLGAAASAEPAGPEVRNGEDRKTETKKEPAHKETSFTGNPKPENGSVPEPVTSGNLARGPEPFEVHRREAMAIREKPAFYGIKESGEHRGKENIPKAPESGKAPETAAANEEHLPEKKPCGEEKRENRQPQQMEMFDGRLLSSEARSSHRLIGQLFDTYWLVEYQNQLFIIDQHAAHEKVLFEKTFATLKTREYGSQNISPPIILTLSLQEEELLKKYQKDFSDIGFEIEPFGGKEYAVRAVPANLFSLAQKDLLMELLDGLSEDTGPAGSELVYDRIASMSCKAAVKGNHRLSEREANELIDQLLKLENPYACPHGRPTIISISRYELEKKFKRIV